LPHGSSCLDPGVETLVPATRFRSSAVHRRPLVPVRIPLENSACTRASDPPAAAAENPAGRSGNGRRWDVYLPSRPSESSFAFRFRSA